MSAWRSAPETNSVTVDKHNVRSDRLHWLKTKPTPKVCQDAKFWQRGLAHFQIVEHQFVQCLDICIYVRIFFDEAHFRAKHYYWE